MSGEQICLLVSSKLFGDNGWIPRMIRQTVGPATENARVPKVLRRIRRTDDIWQIADAGDQELRRRANARRKAFQCNHDGTKLLRNYMWKLWQLAVHCHLHPPYSPVEPHNLAPACHISAQLARGQLRYICIAMYLFGSVCYFSG